MGKRIIQQARGHGSLTYRVRKKAFRIKLSYPKGSGEAKVVKLINSPAHTAPIAKIKLGNEIFFNVAAENLVEGQKIYVNVPGKLNYGDIAMIKDIPTGTAIFNIETFKGGGGKLVRSSGLSAKIYKKVEGGAIIKFPSKKEQKINENCLATIGIIAGAGRTEKPILKAGKMWHIMKAVNRLYPRTSAVKMNAIDHPFGSGRGKRIKSKVPKRNAPPGAKVGLIRARRTGRSKGGVK